MPKKILMTGTPGAGKSTILSLFKKKEKNTSITNLGSVMMEVAKEQRKNIKDRDKLRYMDDHDITEVREEALSRIMSHSRNAIIDTHSSVKQGRRYVPGFSMKELGHMDVDAIIYVDASSDDIIKRRMSDTTRKREIEGPSEIDEQRSINLAIISTIALHLNIPIYILYNRDGMAKDVAEQVKTITKEIFGE
jgi:adenylate kinase